VYRQLEGEVKDLPALPVWEQIQWAQSILAMPNLAFMEIDTTGLKDHDELIRFTLVAASGAIIEDCLIKPATCSLSPEASEINGIKSEQLEGALPITQAWEHIQQALRGRYIISFGMEWDINQLDKAAAEQGLTPLLVIGECLQRHATRYYNGEYYLKLAELCARVGSPLPDYPNQTSLDRARGQSAVLQALAQAITDLRIPAQAVAAEAGTSLARKDAPAGDDFDPFLDSGDLP
jgi:DNA polymerase III epsilon subunit-like protein